MYEGSTTLLASYGNLIYLGFCLIVRTLSGEFHNKKKGPSNSCWEVFHCDLSNANIKRKIFGILEFGVFQVLFQPFVVANFGFGDSLGEFGESTGILNSHTWGFNLSNG